MNSYTLGTDPYPVYTNSYLDTDSWFDKFHIPVYETCPNHEFVVSGYKFVVSGYEFVVSGYEFVVS